MATVVVLADPPRAGLVLPRLPETSPLSPEDAATLYAAMLRDAVLAAAGSGGDLLVNYRPDELLPAGHHREEDVETTGKGDSAADGTSDAETIGEESDAEATNRESDAEAADGTSDAEATDEESDAEAAVGGGDAEAAVRETVEPVLDDPGAARFEEQVGSTRAARVGNTVTHLLEREGASGVIVLDPAAPLVDRTAVDEVAMKLRRSEVVLGPAPGGRVALAAFAEPIDFEEALVPPALETLTDRAGDAGLAVDFRGLEPVVETGADLATVVSVVRARRAADRIVPHYTAETVADMGLSAAGGADGAVRRG